jgi:AcrR family transcriptional regulator
MLRAEAKWDAYVSHLNGSQVYRRAMRADARRNRNAVLEAGARLLAERPAASMQEIADASGVGRTTVYRHFPAREDLVSALVTQVAEELTGIMRERVAAGDAPAEVLRHLAAQTVALGRRWSFLRSQRQNVLASIEEGDRAYRTWVVQAQRAGDLRRDFDADFVLALTRGIITSAIDESDRLGSEHAGRLAGEALTSVLVPVPT